MVCYLFVLRKEHGTARAETTQRVFVMLGAALGFFACYGNRNRNTSSELQIPVQVVGGYRDYRSDEFCDQFSERYDETNVERGYKAVALLVI